jgi:hypothetical protein
MAWAKTVLARVHLLMMMIAILAVGVWSMDHLTTAGGDTPSAGESDAPSAQQNAQHPGHPRLFVFLVDSLRFQTATDPSLMPHLSAMRERSVHAKVLSSRDAVTVSAIREMFTGRERFLAFGFVRDFVTGRESVESIFTQTREANIATSVYPPYAFEQFANDIPPEPIDENFFDRDFDRQNLWVRQGLKSFVSGDKDFVVSHIVYSDRVAHDNGVFAPEYKDTFRKVDELVAELDSMIDPKDTLVIAGDHGHTDNGRHSLGLDVPTFTIYRGAAFSQGVDLGTIPITEHRYLMSWGLGLPLEGTTSSRHPEALRGTPVGPYATAVSPEKARGTGGGPRIGAWAYWLLALATGALFGLWLGIVWERFDEPRRAMVGVWLGLAAMTALVYATWLLALPVLIGAAICWLERNATRLVIATTLGGAAIHAWGRMLAQQRDYVHEPTWSELEQLALLVIALTAVAAVKLGAARASWLALGLIGALGYPTVYRYGAMPALVTMWLAWLAALLVDARHQRADNKKHRWVIGVLAAAGVFVLIQPFAFADAGNFEMHTWRAWTTSLMPHGHEAWIEATFWLKLLIFCRWRIPHRAKPLGLWAAWEVWRVQWGDWSPTDGEWVAMIAATLVAGAVLPRLLEANEPKTGNASDKPIGNEVRRVFWLWGLYLGYYYTIRIPQDHYMWADCFLAAMVLSTYLMRVWSRPKQRAQHEAILSMLSLVVAGWVTVAWTLHLFEWKVLYTWFPAAFVEENALFFIPFINGRYLIPVLMARLLLREGATADYPRKAVWTALGAKVASFACIVSGIGYVMADSEVYLESIGQVAQLTVYAAGLL